MKEGELLESNVNRFNVLRPVLGTEAGVEIMALQKAGKKEWVTLNLVDGKRHHIDDIAEVERDQWSVYFLRGPKLYSAVDLWTKFYKLGSNKTTIMSVIEFSARNSPASSVTCLAGCPS